MKQQIIGIKNLHKMLSKIPDMVDQGDEFIVVKNSKPAFKITSINKKKKIKVTRDSTDETVSIYDKFKDLQFKGAGKNLSKDIDKILY